MRTTLLTSVALLSLAAGSALAQSSNAQNPPTPGAASQQPQPTNSLPSGAASTTQGAPGAALAAPAPAPAAPAVVAPPPAPVAVAPAPVAPMPAPMPAPAPAAAAPTPAAPVAAAPAPAPVATAPAPRRARPPHRATTARRRAPADADVSDGSAPPTEAYRGGAGSPLSTTATDLRPAGRERIGSRLPAPGASSDDPRELLLAAQRDLNAGRTGAAQHGLEMAETRILSRTTEPSQAGQPDSASMVQNIAQARRALGSRDVRGARQSIAAALQDQVPEPGPAVTTIPGTPAPLPAGPAPRTY